jgi:hypothetical protein
MEASALFGEDNVRRLRQSHVNGICTTLPLAQRGSPPNALDAMHAACLTSCLLQLTRGATRT